ncbi:MAG: alpha/beta hydrolase [Actinomycetota bacterium]
MRSVVVVCVVVSVAVLALALPAIERSFIYFPDRDLVATPADVGLPYEDVHVRAEDGVLLQGWFVPGERDVALLWLPGNGGNISHRVELLRRFHEELGVPVLLLDYRGYGASEGRPSEGGTYLDARAGLDALRQRPGVRADRIVYLGQSLGAAVALELALRERPLGVVLESPFTSIRDMASTHYRLHPLRPFVRTRYDSLGRIRTLDVPLLVVHGERDEIAPLWMGRSLYEAAAGPKELHVVPGAGHNDLQLVGGPGYLEVMRRFVDRLPPA